MPLFVLSPGLAGLNKFDHYHDRGARDTKPGFTSRVAAPVRQTALWVSLLGSTWSWTSGLSDASAGNEGDSERSVEPVLQSSKSLRFHLSKSADFVGNTWNMPPIFSGPL